MTKLMNTFFFVLDDQNVYIRKKNLSLPHPKNDLKKKKKDTISFNKTVDMFIEGRNLNPSGKLINYL